MDELLTTAAELAALARAAGATEATARANAARTISYTWRAGALETASEATTRGASVSLLVDGRWASHQTNDLRAASLARFVGEAVALTRALAPDPQRALPDPSLYADPKVVPALDVVDSGIADLTRAQRLEWLGALEAAALGDDRVISVTADVSDTQAHSALVTTNGFAGAWSETSAWNGAEVTVRDAGDRRPEESWGTGGHFRTDLVDPAIVGRTARDRALARLGASKGASGLHTMIVDPRAGGRLVGRLLAPANARSVQQGQSFWAGKLGKRLFSPHLTVIDDPLVPRGLGSRPWDGEGLASGPLTLVEKGIARSLYIDTYYGRKVGMAPTTGSPSNRRFALGDRDLEAWLAEVGRGIYVTSWLGGNADATSGDFSLGLSGFEIADGRIGRPVGEMNVTGNLATLFAQLVGVGNDPWPYGTTRTPTLVFEGVSFAGA